MVIRFACPNGHPLSCPEARIGKPGTCPKCKAHFTVPAVSTLPPRGTASKPDQPQAGSPQKERMIAFLCPNGHELTGPAKLQGKPGQCPHCGAKFQIPNYDEYQQQLAAESAQAGGSGKADSEPNFDGPADYSQEIQEYAELAGGSDIASSAAAEEEYTSQAEALEEIETLEPVEEVGSRISSSAGMASACFKLWKQRGRTGIVEIHLTGGEVLLPEYFAANLSNRDVGMFALKDEEGQFTISAIPWTSVLKVDLRNAPRLTGEFDD